MSERRTQTKINRSAILRLLAQEPKPVPRLSRILRVSPRELWPIIDEMTAAGQVQADKHSYYHLNPLSLEGEGTGEGEGEPNEPETDPA